MHGQNGHGICIGGKAFMPQKKHVSTFKAPVCGKMAKTTRHNWGFTMLGHIPLQQFTVGQEQRAHA
jgi:hypothetical protein